MAGRRYSKGMWLAVVFAVLVSQQPETLSLLDEPLFAPSLSKADRDKANADLAAARAAYDKQPSSPATILALQEAYMALGRIGDALVTLTHGLEANPDEPRLLLERGRGYIVNRKFEPASRDLAKAADKLPAARCTLGLAQYLAGDYARSRESYSKCDNPGLFGYLAQRRSGGTWVPMTIPADPPAPPPTIRLPGSVSPTRQKARPSIIGSYMDAIERLVAGEQDAARTDLKKIVEKHRRDWMEPAYIAAEADYARLKKTEKRKKK
jgi:tetratricopeptide (TPR) repeat protein